MPTTPVLLLPFPAADDPADVPADVQALALGIEAKRGVANGLAGIDAGGKVPTSQLRGPALVTTLPSSGRLDGDEVVLTDSITVPTYRWRFRWSGSTLSTFGWEYVGGTPVEARVAAVETTTTIGSYVNLGTVGPRFTVPRNGDYGVRFGATLSDSAAESQCNIGLGVGDFTAPGLLAEARGHISTANYWLTVVAEVVLAGLTAGQEIRAKYLHAIAGTLTVRDRFLYVTPVRVI